MKALAIAAVGLGLWASSLAATPAEVLDVLAAGGESSLWLIVTRKPADRNGRAVVDLLYRTAVSGRFRRQRDFRASVGAVRAAAAVGERLHVFFAGGAHIEYSPSGQAVRAILPNRAVPRLLFADARTGDLYALVRSPAATKPAASGPADRRRPASQPDRLGLLRYRHEGWEPVTDWLPGPLGGGERLWLCADGALLHGLWLAEESGGRLYYSRWRNQRWSQPLATPVVTDGRVVLVAAINRQLTVLFSEPAGQAGRARLRIARLVGQAWRTGAALRQAGQPLLVEPRRTFAAPLAGKLAVGRWRGSELEVALVEPTQAEARFVAVRIGAGAEARGPIIPDWLAVAIVAGVLVMVFARREAVLVRPAALPGPLACAALWRRVAAFCIDILPAGVATFAFWVVLGAGQGAGLGEAGAAGLWVAWLAVRIVHAIYCGLGEMVTGSSPGKRLLGCRVVAEGGGRASAGAIVLRNMLRILELEVNPPLAALLLLVVITRNRQRLGDVLAHTVVVWQREIGRARPLGQAGQGQS